MADPAWGPRVVENCGEVGYHAMTRVRMESLHAGGIAELDSVADLHRRIRYQERRLCRMLVARNTRAATQTMDGPAGVSSA